MHQKYTEDDIINMLNFLIDNIFVKFGGQVFQQSVGIPMGTNCAPLLADLFLYSYEAEFVQNLIKNGQKKLAQSFNLPSVKLMMCCHYLIPSLVIMYISYTQVSWK